MKGRTDGELRFLTCLQVIFFLVSMRLLGPMTFLGHICIICRLGLRCIAYACSLVAFVDWLSCL